MKKASYIFLAILLSCLCSINKAKSESLDPDLNVLRSRLTYRDFGISYGMGLDVTQSFKTVDDGWRLTLTISGFIQTKSPASLNLTSSDESLIAVKANNKTKEGDLYKYDIQLVYDGAILEQHDYKGISQILIEQEGNEEYRSTNLSFQLEFKQENSFAARVLPYDEKMGVVYSSSSVCAPFGYLLDRKDCKSIKFTFYNKEGYSIKQVNINGVSLGKISYYVAEVGKNYLIEPVWEEKKTVNHTIKITYSSGGSVKVNNQSITSGQSTTVAASTDVKVTITPQTGYHIKQVQLGNSDVTSQLKDNILTISSISTNKEITVIFEKDAPATHNVKVTYSFGGSVKVNNQSVTSGQSATVTASTDVKVTITPQTGYHIKQVQLGNSDVTSQLKYNILTISSISTNKEITVIFEKDAPATHNVKVTYSSGGSVKVNSQSITSGQSATVTASTDVKVTITSQIGYHIKQVRLGTKDVTNQLENNVLTISSILENEEITVTFELNIHTINVTYNESGTVQVDGVSVVSEQSVKVNALSNVKIVITPKTGYHIKQVLLDNKDVFSQLSNNVLTISSIAANKELTVTFEKDTPKSHIIKLAYSSGGSVEINDQSLMSGESFTVAASTNVKVTITLQSGYRIRQVKLGNEDVTNQLSNNILMISAISANVELSISFEQIPTYKLNISMTGGSGSIKIGDKVITESTLISDIKEESSIFINFQSSQYYNIKSVTLGDKDITDQIQNDSYTIESMKSDLTLKIEYVRKQYTLSIDIQGTDKIEINGKEVTNGNSIIINSGHNYIDISSEYYLIKEVLLDNKILNKGSGSYFEINMEKDKKLTIIAELREKRELLLKLEEPGTLASHLSDEDMRMVTDLNISGKIDQRDFLVVNQMQSLYKLSLWVVNIESYNNYPANTIPEKAFHNNKTIKRISFPSSLEAIGKQAFLGSAISDLNESMDNFKYLTKIGEESFKDCQSLIYPPSLYNILVIEKGTFENCSNLTEIATVSPNLKEIKDAAFRNCKNLYIGFDSGLERIGDYAFENVKGVNINDCRKLSHIGTNALKGCQNESFDFENLSDLKVLPSVEECSKLASITFPPNVKEISAGTFKGCTSLRYVRMNESIERIAENAFIDSNPMSELSVPVNTTPEIYANSFSDFTYSVAKLIVPADQLPFYRNHSIWGKFRNIEPLGTATNRQFELSLTAGGFVEIKGDKGIYFDDTFYYEGTNETSYLTSSRIELIITPDQGYSIESVYLNGENITNALDENNLYVIPYLLVDSHFEVKFKKDETTGIEMINTGKQVYLSGTNQLSLTGFPIGAPAFVYDAGGRMVKQIMISESVEKISLPGRGVYFIRVDRESFKIVF